MYNQFFGLNKAPFNMTPDPALLFMPPQHREALAGLTYAILNRKGFAVLIGDAGTGKTTLLARTLQYLQQSTIRSSVILNPTLTANEFLEMTLLGFGIRDISSSKAQRLMRLHQMLEADHAANRVAVLIIDEAHKLSPELLEEVRLLSNFELTDQKLLQIVLIGQDELGDVLNQDRLRQLKQRIAVRIAIGPLAQGEVEQYIRYRWTRCGGPPTLPFLPDAIEAIAAWSQGIPRLINAICDNALTGAFGQGLKAIQASDVLEVARDLDLKPPASYNAKPEIGIKPEKPILTNTLPGSEIGRIRFLDPERIETPPPSLLVRLGRKLGLTNPNREYE
jgi:general secretion pathway protein A